MNVTLLQVVFATIAAWLACASSAPAADITLQIRDGHVTLDARNAPVADILAEWSRVAQTTIVGAEKVSATPITIQMVDVPESAALDVILRQCAGYAASRRPAESAGASVFERIVILASSTAPLQLKEDHASRAPTAVHPVEPRTERRTALPPIDVTPPPVTGVAFESDVRGVSPASFATPWFPDNARSSVPGMVVPSSAPHPNDMKSPNPSHVPQ